MSEWQAATAFALRELRIELEYRRAELAALERAHDILERQVEEREDRCDCYHPDKPCAGELYALVPDLRRGRQAMPGTRRDRAASYAAVLTAPTSTVDSMLTVPRPTMWADCAQEARP